MHNEITCEWKGEMQFEGHVHGHSIMLDDIHPDGTPSVGPTPKRLLLLSAAGCTGMDVIPMLKKMQVPIEGLTIKVEAEGTDTHPKIYTSMKIIYTFSGNDIESYRSKIEHAVTLSQEKYCGVSAMLRMVMPIEIIINLHG
ncbi:MAG TPA: OsmC family protein [Candidatus Kapabacteria bacterium]|nr:OsmC family protein [Candidatus Kapabacteria bacterium]